MTPPAEPEELRALLAEFAPPVLADRPALTVGVMGQAEGDFVAGAVRKTFLLGRAIARAGCTLVTGAAPGLPHAAVCGAKTAGGLTIGISPGLSLDEHHEKYGGSVAYLDAIIYTGSGLMGREVMNIRSSDMVVIAGGRSGTLGEFAIAYDEGKLIGILEGTGGITALVPEVVAVCKKETGAHLVYETDPELLIAQLLDYYHRVHRMRPSVFHKTGRYPSASSGGG